MINKTDDKDNIKKVNDPIVYYTTTFKLENLNSRMPIGLIMFLVIRLAGKADWF